VRKNGPVVVVERRLWRLALHAHPRIMCSVSKFWAWRTPCVVERSEERDDGKKSRYGSGSLLCEDCTLRVEEMEKNWR
jgi:hypothetical protein